MKERKKAKVKFNNFSDLERKEERGEQIRYEGILLEIRAGYSNTSKKMILGQGYSARMGEGKVIHLIYMNRLYLTKHKESVREIIGSEAAECRMLDR